MAAHAASTEAALRAEIHELRRTAAENAARALAERHHNEELRAHNEACNRENTQLRAQALAVAFTRDDDSACDAIVREVHTAEMQGLLADEGAAKRLFADIQRHKSGSQLVWSKMSKAFFTKLSLKGGPSLAEWVSSVLGGPPQKTVRDWRQKLAPFEIGHSEATVEANLARAIQHYEKRGLNINETDFVVCEDGTAHAKHVEVVLKKGKILVFGITGGPYEIKAAADILRLVAQHGLSSTSYVHLLVPQLRGALNGLSR